MGGSAGAFFSALMGACASSQQAGSPFEHFAEYSPTKETGAIEEVEAQEDEAQKANDAATMASVAASSAALQTTDSERTPTYAELAAAASQAADLPELPVVPSSTSSQSKCLVGQCTRPTASSWEWMSLSPFSSAGPITRDASVTAALDPSTLEADSKPAQPTRSRLSRSWLSSSCSPRGSRMDTWHRRVSLCAGTLTRVEGRTSRRRFNSRRSVISLWTRRFLTGQTRRTDLAGRSTCRAQPDLFGKNSTKVD